MIKATYNDADGVTRTNPQEIKITSTWDNTLLHNANRFIGSAKWNGQGGWGLPATKYGQIVCETCHVRMATNIKGIANSIAAPNGTDQFPGQTGGGGLLFESTATPNGFGDDTGGHAVSTKVCEYCHSQNKYHNYNTVNNTAGLIHNNNSDCTQCHPHSVGFFYAAGCDSCHGNPPPPLAGQGGTVGTPTGSANAGKHIFHA